MPFKVENLLANHMHYLMGGKFYPMAEIVDLTNSLGAIFDIDYHGGDKNSVSLGAVYYLLRIK